jgi:hypothetical protein
MKGPAKGKCLCCKEYYRPDRRNLRHQRYCSKPACRKESKARSQLRWLQRPQNQDYFRDPENSQRVKDWRKHHPGYWRKKKRHYAKEIPLHLTSCAPQSPARPLQDLIVLKKNAAQLSNL